MPPEASTEAAASNSILQTIRKWNASSNSQGFFFGLVHRFCKLEHHLEIRNGNRHLILAQLLPLLLINLQVSLGGQNVLQLTLQYTYEYFENKWIELNNLPAQILAFRLV
jgi:hypothetical protein